MTTGNPKISVAALYVVSCTVVWLAAAVVTYFVWPAATVVLRGAAWPVVALEESIRSVGGSFGFMVAYFSMLVIEVWIAERVWYALFPQPQKCQPASALAATAPPSAGGQQPKAETRPERYKDLKKQAFRIWRWDGQTQGDRFTAGLVTGLTAALLFIALHPILDPGNPLADPGWGTTFWFTAMLGGIFGFISVFVRPIGSRSRSRENPTFSKVNDE